MEQILTQNEVDALLTAVSDGMIETEAAEVPEPTGIQMYDLTSQDRVIRERMPTLEVIHDKFARGFSTQLSTTIQRVVTINLASTDFVKFGDFMRNLPLPACISLIRFNPLKGSSIMVLDSRLVFALVDNFFGGQSASTFKIEGRDFTSIELRLVRRVVQNATAELEKAWSPLYPLKIEYLRSEMNPQFAAIGPPSEIVIEMVFEVDLDDISGKIYLVMPYSTVEPIKDKLISGFQSEDLEVDNIWANRFREHLHRVSVDLEVDLGKTEIQVKDLIDLDVGDVIQLDRDVREPLSLEVEGVPKFYCRPGLYKGAHAIKIISPTPRNT